jgi:hypothetical protein
MSVINFQPYHGENKLYFDEMMMMMFALFLNQYVQLVFYSTSSLKQQSVGRHVILSLILNQQVSSLTP